jgi:putative phosphoesterase
MPHVVVLSDIHGNLQALQAVWREIQRRPPEQVLFLGDVVAFGPEPLEVIELLKDEIKPSVALRGNTDRYVLERAWESDDSDLEPDLLESLAWTAEAIGDDGLAYLDSLQGETRHELEDITALLTHASPGNDELGIRSGETHEAEAAFEALDGIDVVFSGHTHIPYRTAFHGIDVFNVGSVGLPFDGDFRASYLSFFIGERALQEVTWCRVPYRRGQTVEILRNSDNPFAEVIIYRLETAQMGRPKAAAST